MKEEKKLPRPSIEVLNQFDELCKQTHDESLTHSQTENLMSKMNEIIEGAEPSEALAILATMALAFESGKSDKSESLASILSGISDITSWEGNTKEKERNKTWK